MKRFVTPKKTLIVANGEKPTLSLLKKYKTHATTTIALDGAAFWLLKNNIKPDIVIGDMDSLDPLLKSYVHIHYVNDQDCNDLEKAFRHCKEHSLSEITVLAAFGLRADHFLTNLFVMRKFASSMILTFIDDKQYAFICPTKEDIIIDNRANMFISLFPLHESVGPIWSTGVQYPLHNEFLSIASRIGTLNKIIAQKASVYCEDGDLLMIVEASAHNETIYRGMPR